MSADLILTNTKDDNNFKDCSFSSKSKYFKEFHDKLMDFWILKI